MRGHSKRKNPLNQKDLAYVRSMSGKPGQYHKLDAQLTGADLSELDLRSAYFGYPNLDGANLSRANLESATFRRANLIGADLSGANLSKANLEEAALQNANLAGANLQNANLRSANLRGADMTGADVAGADFNNVSEIPDLSVATDVRKALNLDWAHYIEDDPMSDNTEWRGFYPQRRRFGKIEIRPVGSRYCVFAHGTDTGYWGGTLEKAIELGRQLDPRGSLPSVGQQKAKKTDTAKVWTKEEIIDLLSRSDKAVLRAVVVLAWNGTRELVAYADSLLSGKGIPAEQMRHARGLVMVHAQKLADIANSGGKTLPSPFKSNPLEESEILHMQEFDRKKHRQPKGLSLASMKAIVADADELRPQFERLIRRAIQRVSGIQRSKILLDRKKAKSITRKVMGEARYSSMDDLKDILRGALLVQEGATPRETDKKMEEVIDLMTSDSFLRGTGFEFVSMNDRRVSPEIYTGTVHLIFAGKAASGRKMMIELQVMPRCMWTIKSQAHTVYERTRVAGGTDEEAMTAAENVMARLFRQGLRCSTGKEYGRREAHLERRERHINPPKRDEIVRRQKKPAQKGSFVGQAITSQERVDTGKFRYIPMPPEIAARYYREGKEPPEKLKVAVVETQTITHWLWNGRDWVRSEDYDVPAEEMPYSAASMERVLREEARKRAGREMTEAYVPPPVLERKAAPKMTKQQKKLLASFKR